MQADAKHAQLNSNSFQRDLREAHEQVLCAMEALGRCTREDAPDEQLLSKARWDLSRASMARRMLWGRILAHLSPRAGHDATVELRRLQDLDMYLLCASTDHINKWTVEAVLAEWQGYCDASREMRRKMIAGMEEEKRILYPLLQALGSHAQQPCRPAEAQANGHRSLAA